MSITTHLARAASRLAAGTALVCASAAGAQGFMAGVDISGLAEFESRGATFFDNGVQTDGVELFKHNGVNTFRLRLFVDPNGQDLVVNDLDHTIALAQRIKAAGGDILLDFHYSDTWADPGKQFKPAGWSSLNFEQLQTQVYDYSRSVIETMAANGVAPAMVQIGNEVSSGVLWDDGRLFRPGVPESTEFDNLAALLSAGINGVRDALPADQAPRVMIHHDQGGNVGATHFFFSRLLPRLEGNDAPIDAIGVSYYPKFHFNPDTGTGGIDDLQTNLNFLADRFDLPVAVVETGFASRGAIFEPDFEFDVSPQGQAEFLQAVIDAVLAVPDGKGLGVFWWQPEAVPVPGPRVFEDGRLGLFDASGNALPAVDVFNAFLPAPTLVGDLNGDGFVGAGDLDLLLGVWNQDAGPGAAADLNGDGFIGAGDLDLLLGNWNRGGVEGGAAAVPEPGTVWLVLASGLGFARRRRGPTPR